MPQMNFEFVSEGSETSPLELNEEQEKALIHQMTEAIHQVQKGGREPDEEKPCVQS
ncbi:MAG: hypothetical protein ACE5M4_15495 [Anaerolineales bacterium]